VYSQFLSLFSNVFLFIILVILVLSARVIADYAHINDIDIIIMGGTKLAKWKYLLVGGSVSTGIIDKSK
jgi:nucleotide-binding universal stress UspA family protein